MLLRLLFLIIILFSVSCSTTYYCRKCLSGGNVIRDTVRFDTTIFVPSVSVDTVIVPYPETSFDTLVIIQDKVKIKFRDLPGPTVYLAADCPPDSIVIEKHIPVVTEVNTGISEARHWLTVGAVGLLLLVVGYMLRRLLG